MALIKCSECGKEISDKAAACVHCGCPVAVSKSAGLNSPDLQEMFRPYFGGNNPPPAPAATPGDITVPFRAFLRGAEDASTPHTVYVNELGQNVQFNVPNNIKVQQSIFLPGQGRLMENGQRGNLYFQVEMVSRMPDHFGGAQVQAGGQTANQFVDAAAQAAQAQRPAPQPAPQPKPAPQQPAPAQNAASPTGDAAQTAALVQKMKAYKYNGFSRGCSRFAGVFIFGIIALFTQGGIDEDTWPVLFVLLIPAVLFIVLGTIHPKRHLKKYLRKHGIDQAIRQDPGTSVCYKMYNAYPSKQMVKCIKDLNPAAGAKLSQALAEMKNKK